MRRLPILFVLATLLTVPLMAGCVEDPNRASVPTETPLPASVQVVDEDGNPIAGALVSASAAGKPLLVLMTDATGRFSTAALPLAATNVSIGAPGFVTLDFAIGDLPAKVQLHVGISEALSPVFSFLPPVTLLCPSRPYPAGKCDAFGEPVMEVAGDGTIWASATCCIGQAPPIWISTDGGLTFAALDGGPTENVRQATGIEGDFAIDEAGNVYFFDILLGVSYFTSYNAQRQHRWTTAWPYEPLVDRPWVRAGAEDQVFVFYNTGSSTNLYTSTTGGLAWEPQALFTLPCALATFGQGPTRERLFFTGCPGVPSLWLSEDGGKTVGAPEPFPVLKKDDAQLPVLDNYMVPVADGAGNIYVTFVQALDAEIKEVGVFMSVRHPDGSWTGPFELSDGGLNEKPWPAAGKEGEFAMAWYHADGTSETQNAAEWYLMTAATIDGASASPHFQRVIADAEPVLQGPFGRQLGDFLEADMTPDGRFTVIYAHREAEVETRFVSSDGGLNLAPEVFLNGPPAN